MLIDKYDHWWNQGKVWIFWGWKKLINEKFLLVEGSAESSGLYYSYLLEVNIQLTMLKVALQEKENQNEKTN